MAQTCLPEELSISVRNVWKIENFSSIKENYFKSKKFCLENYGVEFSWHFVLRWEEPDHKIVDRFKFKGTLSVVVDSSLIEFDFMKFGMDDDQMEHLVYAYDTPVKNRINVQFNVREDILTMRLFLELEKCPLSDKPAKSDLLQNYTSLLTNEQLSDVTIQVGKEKFYAQRAILSVRSPVFAAMFQSGMQEAKLNLITITDFKPAVFQEVLRFIYTDKVKGLNKMAHDLLAAADKYELNKLRKMSETYLLGNLSRETILQTLVLADLYHAQQLKDRAVQFICDNIKTMHTTDWTTFCSNQPELVAEIFSKMAIK